MRWMVILSLVAVVVAAGCSSDGSGGNPDGSVPDAATEPDGAADAAKQSDSAPDQPDAGADAGTDTGPAPLELFYRAGGTEDAVNATSDWEDVPGVTPLAFSATGGDYLFIVNAASPTTADSVGAGLRIMVDGEALATTWFQPFYGQRVSVTPVGLKQDLPAGDHTMSVQWKSNAGKLYLGRELRLLAMRADGAQATTGTNGGPYGGADWTPVPSLDSDPIISGADNLIVLHLPQAWTTAGGSGTEIRVVRDRGIVAMEQVVAGGVLQSLDWTAFPQTLPLTLFGTANLGGGVPHTIGVDVKGSAGLTIVTGDAPKLMVIPIPRPVVQHARSTAQNLEVGAGSGSQNDIDLEPIVFAGDQSQRLVILQAAETWASGQNVGAVFRLKRNGSADWSHPSEYTSAAPLQYMPTTIVRVFDELTLGEEQTFGAVWSATGNDYMNDKAYQGTLYPTTLIGM